METMEISVPDGMAKKEWFTTAEFAAGAYITRRSLNHWLKRHPDFVKKYCQNIGKGERPRYLIFWKGIDAYATLKNDTFNGNRKKSNGIGVDPIFQEFFNKPTSKEILQHGKNTVIQKVNESIEVQKSQDPIIASLTAMIELRQNQIAMGSRLDEVERKVNTAIEVSTAPVEVTAGHRQFLNERVRKYCIAHDLPFHIVWRQVHEYVGVAAVHLYQFKHYTAALKYIRKMYDETGLVW